MTTGIDMAIGLLTDIIYDIFKHEFGKFSEHFSPINKNGICQNIEAKIKKTLPDNLKPLFESSTFITYFNSPQFLDFINSYLTHKIIYKYSEKNTKIKRYADKCGIISADDVTNYISGEICALYEKSDAISPPSKTLIQQGVDFILYIADEILAQKLSPETSRMLYLINSRTDLQYKEIISALTKLQHTANQIQSKQLSPHNDDHEEIRKKYHSVLQEKNSEAHIYLLDKFPFEKFYVPPILQRISDEQTDIGTLMTAPSTPWNNIWKHNNIIYLIGGAGYGKSLFTKKIINSYENLNIFRSKDYLVICGELKTFYPNGSESPISVTEFLKNSIKNSTLTEVSTDFTEHYLNSGRCIILLDALDEVEKSKRSALHESIVAFFKSQNPNNKICITSRDRGFIPERNVEVFKICPLDDRQIAKYVDKIIALGKFEKSDKGAFMKQTEILVKKGFLNSFLVLSLLINIYKAEQELPENKLDLYRKCFEYIASKREKDKTQKQFDWKAISPIMKDNTFIELSEMGLPNNSEIEKNDIKKCLLQVYKAKYLSEADTENAVDEFLKFCSDRTELFVPTGEDKYKFFHRSFFEYFYSCHIFLRCGNEKDILTEFLKFDVDSEVFELTVAMLKQQTEDKYQALVKLMLETSYEELNSGENGFSVFNILILSMQSIDDALYRKMFSDMIIEKKTIILKNIKEIHNLKLISSIYENDSETYKKVSEAYYKEYLTFIFDNCNKMFKVLSQCHMENGESIFEKTTKLNNLLLRRRIAHLNIDAERYFYVPIVSEVSDTKNILINTSKKDIENALSAVYPENFKDKVSSAMSMINIFKDFSDKDKEKLIDLILNTQPSRI